MLARVRVGRQPTALADGRTSMRIVVDTDKCIGTGVCVAACPEVFSQTDDGTVIVLNSAPGPELEADVDHAIAVCPAACIRRE
jgi:ferredoxin